MKSVGCPNTECALSKEATAGTVICHGFYNTNSGRRRRYMSIAGLAARHSELECRNALPSTPTPSRNLRRDPGPGGVFHSTLARPFVVILTSQSLSAKKRLAKKATPFGELRREPRNDTVVPKRRTVPRKDLENRLKQSGVSPVPWERYYSESVNF